MNHLTQMSSQCTAYHIWLVSLVIKELTSDHVFEKIGLIHQHFKASAGAAWVHESFDVSNPKCTQSWLCWADALFVELVISVTDQYPHDGYKSDVLSWEDSNVSTLLPDTALNCTRLSDADII